MATFSGGVYIGSSVNFSSSTFCYYYNPNNLYINPSSVEHNVAYAGYPYARINWYNNNGSYNPDYTYRVEVKNMQIADNLISHLNVFGYASQNWTAINNSSDKYSESDIWMVGNIPTIQTGYVNFDIHAYNSNTGNSVFVTSEFFYISTYIYISDNYGNTNTSSSITLNVGETKYLGDISTYYECGSIKQYGNSCVEESSGGKIKGISAGTTTVIYNKKLKSGYIRVNNGTPTTSCSGTYTFNITVKSKLSSSITQANIEKTYGNAAFTITPTCTGISSIKWTSSDTNVISLSSTSGMSNTATIKGVGSSTITLTGTGASGYNGSTKTFTITVKKATSSITQADITKTYGNAAFTITPTRTGVSSLSWSLSKTGVVSLSVTTGNSVTATIQGVGTVTVTLTGTGATGYDGSTKTFTIKVNKATPSFTSLKLNGTTISSSGQNQFNGTTLSKWALSYTTNVTNLPVVWSFTKATEGGTESATEASTVDGNGNPVNPDIVEFTGNYVRLLKTGTAYLSAKIPETNYYKECNFGNFAEVKITKGTFGFDYTYNGSTSNVQVTYGATSSIGLGYAITPSGLDGSEYTLPMSGTSSNTSVATVSGSTVTIKKTGTTTISGNAIPNSKYEYNGSTSGSIDITVIPMSSSVTIKENNTTISGTVKTIAYGGTLTITGSSSPAGMSFSWSSSHPAAVSLSSTTGNTVKLTVIGVITDNVTITCTASGGNATNSTATLGIKTTKASTSIQSTSPLSKEWAGTNNTILSVTYSVSHSSMLVTPSSVIPENFSVSPNGAGKVALTFKKPHSQSNLKLEFNGNTNLYSSFAYVGVTCTKPTSTIVLNGGQNATYTYNSLSFQLSYVTTKPASRPVTFKSDDTSIVTVSTNGTNGKCTVTVKNVSSSTGVTITATAPAHDYFDAVSTSIKVIINKGTAIGYITGPNSSGILYCTYSGCTATSNGTAYVKSSTITCSKTYTAGLTFNVGCHHVKQSNGSDAKFPTITYKSTDESVATVSSTGVVSFKKAGTTKIYAAVNDSRYNDAQASTPTYYINVTLNKGVSSVTFNSDTSVTYSVGMSLKPSAYTTVPAGVPITYSITSTSKNSVNEDNNSVIVFGTRETVDCFRAINSKTGVITFSGLGEGVIKGSFAGNDLYNASYGETTVKLTSVSAPVYVRAAGASTGRDDEAKLHPARPYSSKTAYFEIIPCNTNFSKVKMHDFIVSWSTSTGSGSDIDLEVDTANMRIYVTHMPETGNGYRKSLSINARDTSDTIIGPPVKGAYYNAWVTNNLCVYCDKMNSSLSLSNKARYSSITYGSKVEYQFKRTGTNGALTVYATSANSSIVRCMGVANASTPSYYLGGGTYTANDIAMTAYITENDTYKAASYTFYVKVDKANPTLKITNTIVSYSYTYANVVTTKPTVSYTLTGPSGLCNGTTVTISSPPVSLSSGTTSVISLSGKNLVLKKAGNSVITASYAGGGNYNSATAAKTFTVTRSTPTLVLNPSTTNYLIGITGTYTISATVSTTFSQYISSGTAGSSSSLSSTCTWGSSKTTIATVSTPGASTTLTKKGKGVTSITCTFPQTEQFNSVSKTVQYTIYEPVEIYSKLLTGSEFTHSNVALQNNSIVYLHSYRNISSFYVYYDVPSTYRNYDCFNASDSKTPNNGYFEIEYKNEYTNSPDVYNGAMDIFNTISAYYDAYSADYNVGDEKYKGKIFVKIDVDSVGYVEGAPSVPFSISCPTIYDNDHYYAFMGFDYNINIKGTMKGIVSGNMNTKPGSRMAYCNEINNVYASSINVSSTGDIKNGGLYCPTKNEIKTISAKNKTYLAISPNITVLDNELVSMTHIYKEIYTP